MTDEVTESSLVEQVDRDWAVYRELGLDFTPSTQHSEFWNKILQARKQQLGKWDEGISAEIFKNFRGENVCVADNPSVNSRGLHRLSGQCRGERAVLKHCLSVIKANGFQDLLRKYPTPSIGGPAIFEFEGFRYTHRWSKAVYHLGLLNKVLGDRLTEGFVSLDIGSSYGVFSSLLFQEYPKTHHVLVDLPEQLIFARYFLGKYFPGARIAGPEDLNKDTAIDRELVGKYDFLLVAPAMYEKFVSGSADLVSSFACLGELNRTFFDFYLQAPVFKGAQYFFTANPVDPMPWTQGADVCLMDYPILNADKRLHFRMSPMFDHGYWIKNHNLFGYKLDRFDPFFECITAL